MQITKKSLLSGKTHTMEIDVTEEQIVRWAAGEVIQNVMPNLTAGEREFIKTGITEEEWDAEFANLEKDDD